MMKSSSQSTSTYLADKGNSYSLMEKMNPSYFSDDFSTKGGTARWTSENDYQ